MRNKNALMKYGNERASNHEINFSLVYAKTSILLAINTT